MRLYAIVVSIILLPGGVSSGILDATDNRLSVEHLAPVKGEESDAILRVLLDVAVRYELPVDAEQFGRLKFVRDEAPILYAALSDVVERYDVMDQAAWLALRNPDLSVQQSFLDARRDVLKASLHLGVVARTTPPLPVNIVWPGLLDLDLTGMDTLHEVDVRILVDTGGNDTYRNNAGGSMIRGFADCPYHAEYGATAIAIDVSGDDHYEGTGCGVNGGASRGVGMLIDMDGNDIYNATSRGRGKNGGAQDSGYGMLVDLHGDDTYVASDWATNGGAGYIIFLPPAPPPDGTLIDLEGNDTYLCSAYCNGGTGDVGHGRLIDLSGNDIYACGSYCNGGTRNGQGFLFDAEGDDIYRALSSFAANGAAHSTSPTVRELDVADPTVGLLLDGGGRDTYISGGITEFDATVIPKSSSEDPNIIRPVFGAQIDLSSDESNFTMMEAKMGRIPPHPYSKDVELDAIMRVLFPRTGDRA